MVSCQKWMTEKADGCMETKISNKHCRMVDGLVAEWLACWTQAQKGLGSNCSHDAVWQQS